MAKIDREDAVDFFGDPEWRYSVGCFAHGEYCGDIAKFGSPDVAEICFSAIRAKFPKAEFVLDDIHAPRSLHDMLEAISDG